MFTRDSSSQSQLENTCLYGVVMSYVQALFTLFREVIYPKIARYGIVWYGMVWYGMVWYGMVWYGMVWYGMVWYEYEYDVSIM